MKRLDRNLLKERVSQRILNDIENHHLLGASVLVRQEGEVFLDAQFGYSDLQRSKPLNENAVFRIVSMSKVISAVAEAKKNASKIGKFNPQNGCVSVYVDDLMSEVLLGTDGLKHGLRFNQGTDP